MYEVDSLTDSPTNYGTDNGAGAQVRGNYCTWNSNANIGLMALSQGNLRQYWSGSGWKSVLGTHSVSSGKWYYEYTCEL